MRNEDFKTERSSKLTIYDVMYIRYKRYYGEFNMTNHASNLGVDHSCVFSAAYGKSYKWLPLKKEDVEKWWIHFILTGEMRPERREIKIHDSTS